MYGTPSRFGYLPGVGNVVRWWLVLVVSTGTKVLTVHMQSGMTLRMS